MNTEGRILVGRGAEPVYLALAMANRHGLIAGATGTGKTVTLQGLAEGFSAAGTPVFAADVKGDLAGLSQTGAGGAALTERAGKLGITYEPDSFPVMFWDIYGEQGTPIRATVSEMGPMLLGRLLGLNDTQAGVLTLAFKLADDENLLLLDLKDLQALLAAMADRAGELSKRYGNVTKPTIGAIQRQLLVLQQQGGDHFFAEPALEIADLMRRDPDGRGIINILAADKLINNPQLYATFLLWLLSELFERLPEIGDPDKPVLVFVFDEAHLLFTDAPASLVQKIEQVVRLVRSKGVGVYFCTQNPLDVPDTVLGQLGNRVQHALRAYTPRDQRAVKAAADTFRSNPALDTATVISELGKGEALVSMLDGSGVPAMVSRALIRPPQSRIGPITPQERQTLITASPLAGRYGTLIDRDSAFEMLQRRAAQTGSAAQQAAPAPMPSQAQGGAPQSGGLLGGVLGGILGESAPRGRGASNRMPMGEAIVRTVARSMASTAGRQITNAIIRGVLGGLTRR